MSQAMRKAIAQEYFEKVKHHVFSIADSRISNGYKLIYDGEVLDADDFVDLLLPTMIAIANGLLITLSETKIQDLPFFFKIPYIRDPGELPFYLEVNTFRRQIPISRLGPLLDEVFEVFVLPNRKNLGQLIFQTFAKIR